jgi:hypothetical protein
MKRASKRFRGNEIVETVNKIALWCGASGADG